MLKAAILTTPSSLEQVPRILDDLLYLLQELPRTPNPNVEECRRIVSTYEHLHIVFRVLIYTVKEAQTNNDNDGREFQRQARIAHRHVHNWKQQMKAGEFLSEGRGIDQRYLERLGKDTRNWRQIMNTNGVTPYDEERNFLANHLRSFNVQNDDWQRDCAVMKGKVDVQVVRRTCLEARYMESLQEWRSLNEQFQAFCDRMEQMQEAITALKVRMRASLDGFSLEELMIATDRKFNGLSFKGTLIEKTASDKTNSFEKNKKEGLILHEATSDDETTSGDTVFDETESSDVVSDEIFSDDTTPNEQLFDETKHEESIFDGTIFSEISNNKMVSNETVGDKMTCDDPNGDDMDKILTEGAAAEHICTTVRVGLRFRILKRPTVGRDVQKLTVCTKQYFFDRMVSPLGNLAAGLIGANGGVKKTGRSFHA